MAILTLGERERGRGRGRERERERKKESVVNCEGGKSTLRVCESSGCCV